ncbi:O-antigen polysaccharide polymerase Wzy [Lentzea aerocolonigenes]|uniref:O-antigen polysaccharide polymerase Wzy n=1 Tax=Lentzea aerocolonigenes TaxID=68170 RepID=UPI00138DDFAC|nr:O-antigen polysaccharide polymerase Wzy [Lentzea aerocolonigenes]
MADGVDRVAMSGPRRPAGDVPLSLLAGGGTGWRRRADEAAKTHGRRGRSGVEPGELPVLRDGAIPRELPARIALVAAAAVVAAVGWRVPSSGVVPAAVTFWASWSLCLAVLVRGHPQGIYRPAATYLVLFGLFHGGLLLSVAVRGDSVSEDARWLEDAHTPQAVSLAVLGMVGYTVAAGLAGRGAPPAAASRGGAVTGPLGLAVQLAGTGIFAVALVRAGGIDLLWGGYNAYVEANGTDTLLAFGTLCSGTGALLAVSAGGRARVAGWAGFVLYAVIALPLGTRGEVLFPLMAMAVIEARRHRIRPLWTALAAAGVLLLADVVRQTRIGGVLSPSWWLTAPLDAIAEMGFSLRPVVVVLGWDEPVRAGATFVAVPVRFLESFLGWHGGSPTYDDRLFNVEIANRAGQIGGSPVAEAFHNFGTLGVVLFMAALGVLLARLEKRSDAVIGVVLLPLMIQVRNSFAPVPVQIGIGLLLVALTRVRLR